MNIAVLLRGKQNFSKTTSALFERLVCERFPYIDFKFFIHTWNSLPISPGSANRLSQETQHKSVIYEKISHWNPVSFELGKEKELLNIIKKILKKQSIDDAYHSWAQEQKNASKKHELVSPFFIDRSRREYIDNIDQIIASPDINNIHHIGILHDVFSGFYLTGQMYSAMKAFSLYKSYSENNNYVPDLVICTRPDVVLSLNKRCFYKIIELLDIVCYEDTSNIVSSEVRTVKGQGWVQDYAFITNIKGADDFLGGDPEKRLLDLTFNHRSRTTGLLDSSGLQAHMLWPILGHKCTFVEASFFLSTLVRREFSNNDFINISQKKIFKQINCELLQWFEIKKPDYPLSTETLLNEIRRINA